ncbi:MAG: BTAD domain-containing putative transcriptional regulator, partial [Oscillospiraceae bacterium]|nr:BTAD domain-containing putative transcriptional regulator [Oscillospiraceae bacterium]
MDAQPVSGKGYLQIYMLGSFKVYSAKGELSGSRARTSLMWKLFKYLIINRGRAVSTEKLIDVLWPSGECEDPLRALYTLVYRLRSALSEGAGEKLEFIIYENDSYIWNSELPVFIDYEEFLKCAAEAKPLGDEAALPLLEEAFGLFRGDLLSDMSEELWMLTSTSRAHAAFCELAGRLINIYLELERADDAAKACEHALTVDNYEEGFHLGLLRALLAMGRHSLALAHYEYYCAMLYNELGVMPT